MLLVTNLANDAKHLKNGWNDYSYESTPRELSNEYQQERV